MSDNIQNTTSTSTSQQPTNADTLVGRMAASLNVDAKKLWSTLQASCFRPGKDGTPFTQEQVMLVLIIAEQLGLNPLKREIYAFKNPDGSVVPLLSIDGWKQIMLRNSNFNGFRIDYSDKTVELQGAMNPVPEWAECTIYVKDRDYPTTERVYAREVYMPRSPVWQKSPATMLHHRALIRAIRFTFPVSGVGEAEEDEVPVISQQETTPKQSVKKPGKTVVFNDQQKLSQWIDKAVLGCQKLGSWQNTIDCVSHQFGNEEEREFALLRLQKAREDFERSAIEVHAVDESSETEDVVA